ncbi:uncharacterized protein LOC109834809 [Asparagus officinalis]|uniref:uncharacterized protein LOC109834809 n=1 Tax=Asparagus officinalis TaxID=4686 RepID=UPI00098DFC3E|nr:uncharacterized protein LOC109834809 [Asparagus officinalis]
MFSRGGCAQEQATSRNITSATTLLLLSRRRRRHWFVNNNSSNLQSCFLNNEYPASFGSQAASLLVSSMKQPRKVEDRYAQPALPYEGPQQGYESLNLGFVKDVKVEDGNNLNNMGNNSAGDQWQANYPFEALNGASDSSYMYWSSAMGGSPPKIFPLVKGRENCPLLFSRRAKTPTPALSLISKSSPNRASSLKFATFVEAHRRHRRRYPPPSKFTAASVGSRHRQSSLAASLPLSLALYSQLKDEISFKDHYDVKMPCHLILSKLAVKCPSAVLAVLDSLVDPLERTINHKPKLDAVKQEVDRNEDMIRSALRAIASLSRIRK